MQAHEALQAWPGALYAVQLGQGATYVLTITDSDRLVEQVLLPIEVLVDQPIRHPRGLGDGADGGGVVAALAELLQSGGQDGALPHLEIVLATGPRARSLVHSLPPERPSLAVFAV